MDTYDSHRSPPGGMSETKYRGREETMDRPPMHEGHRRRSPGPGSDRRGNYRGPRPRSRSPVLIDRYQPGDRRDDFFGQDRDHPPRDRPERRRAPSPPNIDRYVPGQNGMKSTIRTNPLPNPISLDFQVGFTWFAEWWRTEQLIKEDKENAKSGGRRPPDRGIRGEREVREEREKERTQIQAAYDAYKEDLQIKMARIFVLSHKGEEWFKERYFDDLRVPFRAQLTEHRRGALAQFNLDLDSGTFDDFNLEGIYKAESNGAGGVVEREEGETVAAAEVLGVGDLVPSRGADSRDDSALRPALLIKTLAPMVSREKIEAFCKEHLGEEAGGFDWLSLSDPNPLKKYHRIGWIMLNPAQEGEEMPQLDERGDGREEEDDMEEKPKVEEDNDLKPPGVKTAEKALEKVNSKIIYDETRGDFTCHVGVHFPPREPRKKALWDLFSAPERVERDAGLAKRLVAKFDLEFGDVDTVAKVEERVEDLRSKGWLQPTNTGRISDKAVKAAEDEDQDMEDGEEDGAIDEDDVDSEELLMNRKVLDLLVEYLRRVYNFCFFCVFEADSVHELIRKCPGGHLRRPRASLSTAAKAAAKASALGQPFPVKRQDSAEEGSPAGSPAVEKFQRNPKSKNEQQLQRAFSWVKIFEEKVLQIVDPDNVDIKKLGGTEIEEGLTEELKKYLKQEDEAKFRCKVPGDCTKLFKGESFWRKHVEKRHSEFYESIKKDLILVNKYVLDPAHIAPSRTDANSNGHFPPNNQHVQFPTGTPRGFNLQNMQQMNMMGFQQNAFGNNPSTAMNPFSVPFGNHTVQPPNGAWPNQNMMGGGMPMGMNGPLPDGTMGGSHQTGPMRRGGGRFNPRQPGPYDRRNAGGMQNRMYGQPNGGRLSPPGGARNMMGNGGMGMMGAPGSGGGRGGGMMGIGAGARWDSGGQQAMGPKEAVQGRSLKSYEDLDAVGADGAGELNY